MYKIHVKCLLGVVVLDLDNNIRVQQFTWNQILVSMLYFTVYMKVGYMYFRFWVI